MNVIEINVPGEPVGKGRPRFSTAGGFGRAYTPKKTSDYEAWIRQCYHDQSPVVFGNEEPLMVSIRAWYKIPKSMTKADRELAIIGKKRPVVKPDLDNIAKSALDALNGVAFGDDKQVVLLDVGKAYSEQPRVEIWIRPI